MYKLSDHQGLLYAAQITKESHKVEVDLKKKNAHNPDKHFLWLHMCAVHPDSKTFFKECTELDELVINAMLAEHTRPRILVRDEGVMLIIRAANLYKDSDPEDMISLRIWIDDKRIITTRRRDIMAINDMKELIEQNQGPTNTGDFLTMITDRAYGRMQPFIEDLEERIGNVEELVAHKEIQNIANDSSVIGVRTAIFNRYIIPQKTVIESLIKEKFTWLSEEHVEHLIESHDRITRYVETLSDIKERFLIANDEINKIQDAKLNSTTYMFSLAATIFLPLSFLTGLLGINIGGMPGVDNNQAFWIFTLICLLITILQVIIFKKKKWF